VKPLIAGRLSVEPRATRAGLELQFLGSSEQRDPAATLAPFFGDVSKQLQSPRHVTLDFRQLDYMNSASVRPVLDFIQRLAADGHQVTVKYSTQKNWQRLSFKAAQAVLANLQHVSFES
jgi:hypothetical protein